MQQLILPLLLVGCSLHRCSYWVGLDRRTQRRWWDWLASRNEEFGFFLRSRFLEWGRVVDWRAFRLACLDRTPLRGVMTCLDQDGLVVP